MKTKITLLGMGLLFFFSNLNAQISCTDLNAYVNSKNTGGTTYDTLRMGQKERISQTYHFSGSGNIGSIRVYGNFPDSTSGVPLKIGIYNVDSTGRPTSLIRSSNTTWWSFYDSVGFIDVPIGGGGAYVSNNFAVAVELRAGNPSGNSFMLQYTGNGEGQGQDLASIFTGTDSTWKSARNSFGRDGDYYLIPQMTHFITSQFTLDSSCVSTGSNVTFTNTTQMSVDSMFNTIALSAYADTNNLYTWDFGDSTALSHTKNPVHAYADSGSYTVRLISMLDGWNNNCSDTTSMMISVGLSVRTTATTSITCNSGANGSITVIGSGGAMPYSYSLDSLTFQTDTLFNGLSGGIHTVYIKDSLGCAKSIDFSLAQAPAMTITTSVTPTSACDTANGSITVTALGGIGTLQYQLDTAAFQMGNSFTGLSAGVYNITVMDSAGCTDTTYAFVNDPGGPVFDSTASTMISCAESNGTITLVASGGSGTLQYSINEGATFQNSGNFTGLAAGNYPILVIDSAGCRDLGLLVVEQPEPIIIQTSVTPVTCNGGNNGEIKITSATGGIGSLTYSIDGTNYQADTVFTGLTPATYTVSARDTAACVATTTVTITQPAPLELTTSITPLTCNGSPNAGISVMDTSGVEGLMYSINGLNFQPVGLFSNLDSGSYSIYIKDSLGCADTVQANITNALALSVTVTTTSSTCGNTNGGILAIASGGSGDYQYSMDGITYQASGSFDSLSAGTYSIIVKDSAGCNEIVSGTIMDSNGPVIDTLSHTDVTCHGGLDGTITINMVSGGTGAIQYSINGVQWQSSPVFTGLEAGAYDVLVKDTVGCLGSKKDTILEPNAIVIVPDVTDIKCFGFSNGSAIINASGGTGTLSYSNNGGAFQPNNTFTSLSVGTYTISVRDAGNCTATDTFAIAQPAEILINDSITHVPCSDSTNGSITINATGGLGTYEYSMDGITYQGSNTFLNVPAGNYTLFVKDTADCIKTKAVSVIKPSALVVTDSVSTIKCHGGSDGSILLTVTGGTPNYTYTWSNSGGSSTNRINLPAGVYNVAIVDANGCTSNKSYTLTEPAAALVVNASVTDASDANSNDGEVDITVTGGVDPYTYDWSNGATTEDLTGLNSGNYTVNITDSSGCETNNSFVVGMGSAIDDLLTKNNTVIYPNPATENVTVSANGAIIQSLKIINILGQVMIELQPKNVKVEVNVLAIQPGSYFVQVIFNDTLITKKLEIIR